MKLNNFIPDIWQEVFNTIGRNKFRTFLTGMAVSWGIFIFIILLGAGNSLKNGIQKAYESNAINTISIQGGITSKEYKGLNAGRRLKLQNKDASILENYFNNIDKAGKRTWFDKTVRFENEVGNYTIVAMNLEDQQMDRVNVLHGRKLNKQDMKTKRKIAFIGIDVFKNLLKSDISKINDLIYIDNVPFTFAGVYKDKSQPWKNNDINIPITTAQLIFGKGIEIGNITVSANVPMKESKILEEKIRFLFSRIYKFRHDDERALRVENNIEEYYRTMSVLVGIKLFVGIIGVLTLISGITGISNIMFVVIKERTKEIGIRKALGANPKSIIKTILLEAVFITTIAGYLGMFVSILILDGLDFLLQKAKSGEDGGPLDLFVNPKVDINMAISATILLIIAGVIAGYFPARKAAKISPIEALRYE